jgi:hypothetical protein
MRRMTEVYACRIFKSVKMHFSSGSYNLLDYDFNFVKMSDEQFAKRGDRFLYKKVIRKVRKDDDWFYLCVAVLKDNPSLWVGDICDNLEECLEKKENLECRLVDLPRTFETQSRELLSVMFDKGYGFDERMPKRAYNAFEKGKMSLEVFIIWKKLFNIEKALIDDLNYRYGYGPAYIKYESILNVNIDHYKSILKSVVKELKNV